MALGRISEGYQSLSKATESFQVELKRLGYCFPVKVTEFKLSKATSASAFVASHSIQRLVMSFVVFQISTMSIYILVSNYYVFLESGIKLFSNYLVGA